MHRFESRIYALIRKTHNFISHADYRLIRDYLSARLEAEEKPADFDEKVGQFRELDQKCRRSASPEIEAEGREIIESSVAVTLGAFLPWAEDNCRRFPSGRWEAKWDADEMRQLVRDAKKYFANAKERELDQQVKEEAHRV